MSARKINPFKGTNVLHRLRAKARTGMKAPGWVMAAMTAVPPGTLPAQPSKIPKLVLPTDRLLAGYERRFPEASDEVVRTVDGLLVNRSMVFVQKQHDFIKRGHTEAEAFKLTEKALVEEESRALKQLEEMTAEARAKGAVPAISAIEREQDGDSRWERLQFWRKELGESPYETWSHGKQASLDRWLTKDMLGWAPHQTRYLGQERFMVHLQAVRELIFADVLVPMRQKLKGGGEGEVGLTEEELYGLRYQTAMGEYREWEGKLVGRRGGDWGKEGMEELQQWVDENYELILTGVRDAWPQVEGGVTDMERKAARRQVLLVMAFPLLRPEMQGVPYLSRYLTRAFSEVSKYEACAGLRPIVSSSGPLGKAKADYAVGESVMNDAMPKLVVKSFVTLALERPFAWQLMRYLLIYRISNAPSVAALENLPELRGMGGRGEIAKHVEGQWKNLTDILMTLAVDDDTSGLGQDIEMAYEGINELHRVAQELLFLEAAEEGGKEGGHSFVDREIAAYVAEHHGWVDEDLAIGEVLRRYDATVEGMFGADIPPAHKAQVARVEKRESEVLESARLDFAFSKREGGRWAWERAEGRQEVDEYDREWLARRKVEVGEEEGGEGGMEGGVNEEDLEDWQLELKASGIKTAEEEEEEKKAKEDAKSAEASRGGYEPRGDWQRGGDRGRGRGGRGGGRGDGRGGGRGGGDRFGGGGRDREGQYGGPGRGGGNGGRGDDRRGGGGGAGGGSSFAGGNRFASATGGQGQRWPSSDGGSSSAGRTEGGNGGAGAGAFGRGGGGGGGGFRRGNGGGRGGGERGGSLSGGRGRGRGGAGGERKND